MCSSTYSIRMPIVVLERCLVNTYTSFGTQDTISEEGKLQRAQFSRESGV